MTLIILQNIHNFELGLNNFEFRYLYSFSKRTDFSTVLGAKLDKYVNLLTERNSNIMLNMFTKKYN